MWLINLALFGKMVLREDVNMVEIITAIIVGGLSLVGVIFTSTQSSKKIEQQLSVAQAVTDTKIEQLTEEVRKHNTFADRITKLEVEVDMLKSK